MIINDIPATAEYSVMQIKPVVMLRTILCISPIYFKETIKLADTGFKTNHVEKVFIVFSKIV